MENFFLQKKGNIQVTAINLHFTERALDWITETKALIQKNLNNQTSPAQKQTRPITRV
jgi:hypothetical protein